MVRREGFGLPAYLAFAAATVFTLLVCVSLGSVKLPLRETFGLLWNALAGRGTGNGHERDDRILRAPAARAVCCAHGRVALGVRRGDAGPF